MLHRSLLLLVVSALVLLGCNPDSYIGKRYDNFTAYYNTFYNAKKSLREGVASIDQVSQPVNRDRFLPVFSGADRAASGQAFENAVRKGADVLREHPSSKWADDALMLIGRSYFYQRNYVGSAQKFTEVIEADSKLSDEARFWLARVLIASADYERALTHISESLNREGLDDRWEGMLRLALGELYVKQGAWESASEELAQGLQEVDDNEVAARAQYLLGQVYEMQGRYEEAYEAYRRVRKYKPFYELSYAAQYGATRVDGEHLNADRALRTLRKMERDDKNFSYRNELLYLRGRLYKAQGRYNDAIDLYYDVLYDDTPGNNIAGVRGPIHYTLGELYREGFTDYLFAAAHYDTASAALRGTTSSNRGGALEMREDRYTASAITDAEDKAEQHMSFAQVYDDLAHMDSLLFLGSLDPEAFDARILELRQLRAEELAEQRRQQVQRQAEQNFQQAAATAQRNTRGGSGKVIPGYNDAGLQEGSFLFHDNPARVQEGLANFIAIWGERPRVPNWRRLDAITDAREQGNVPEDALDLTAFAELEEELPQIDISGIPRDSTTQAAMRQERALARYELANVLFLGMNRPDSAAVWYRMVIEEDAAETVAQRAFYALAEVQQALGDTTAAEQIFRQVLREYPETDFANRIRIRLGVPEEEETDSLALAEDAYDRLYANWQQGSYQQALDGMIHLAHDYPSTATAPRALIAAGSVYTTWAVQDSLDLFDPIPTTVPDSVLYAIGLIERPPAPDTTAQSLTEAAGPEAEDPATADLVPADSLNTVLNTVDADAAIDTAIDTAIDAAVPDSLGGETLPAESLPADTLNTGFQGGGSRGGGSRGGGSRGDGTSSDSLIVDSQIVDSLIVAADSLEAELPAEAPAAASELQEEATALEEPVLPIEPERPPLYVRDLFAFVTETYPNAPAATFAQTQLTTLDELLREREAAAAAALDSTAADSLGIPVADSLASTADALIAAADTTAQVDDAGASAPENMERITVARGGWTVIVGSETNIATAAEKAGALARIGEPMAIFQAAGEEGETRYRVALGQFDSDNMARQYKNRNAAQLPEGAWILQVTPDMEALDPFTASTAADSTAVPEAIPEPANEEGPSFLDVIGGEPEGVEVDEEERVPEEVLDRAEVMPQLIGGMPAVMEEFNYPEEAAKAGISGPVFLEIVVSPRGTVLQPRVVRGVGFGCDQEALRVIQLARYEPAEQGGASVAVRQTITIMCAAP